jgi:DNA mismatch endonuclease (patch repair protein)
MPDIFSKAKRSVVMSQIRSRGNKTTELTLARLLRAHRITGWRRHQTVSGRPDFVFTEARLAVFVDGCFWHGCRRHSSQPKTNGSFWQKKLDGNVARDRRVNRELRISGWRVVRIWEHDLPKRGEYWAKRIKRLLSES